MILKPSGDAQFFRHLLSGTHGVCLVALDPDLRITFSTPHTLLLCGLHNLHAPRRLPEPLEQSLRQALGAGTARLAWRTRIAGQARTIEIHLSHTLDADGKVDGHVLLLVDASSSAAAEGELWRRNAVLNALITIDLLLHSAESWQAALPDVTECIGAASEFSRIQVFRKLLDGSLTSRLSCLHQWSAPDAPPLAEDSLTAFSGCTRWLQALKRGEAVFGSREDFPASEQGVLRHRQTRDMALIPIFSGTEWWGLISFEHCREGATLSAEEIAALQTVGRSLGVAIQRQVAGNRLQQAKIAFDSAVEGIMTCDAQNRITAINKGFTTITGYGESEVIGRTPEILRSGKHAPEFFAAMRQSLSQAGRWRGEIWNRRKNGELFPSWLTITTVRNSQDEITDYVSVFADISEIKQSQQSMHRLINHDPLTGLPNRRLLNELLEHAIRHAERGNRRIALLFLDLDRFKNINDTLGHHAGDTLLSSVAQRLTASVRDSDTIARLGGDEFVIMMDGLQQAEDAAIVARKIIAALEESFIIDGRELFIGASIGISLYPADGLSANDLIKAADIAMYEVKHGGKNNFRFYTSHLGENADERLALDTMLRHALERQQLVLHYQPQISLKTGAIVGAEALLRWQHPELGMVPPGKFIPLAEETGLIIQIGEWVLRQATTDLLRLSEAGCPLQGISVNVSATQILRSNFPDTVYGVLVETGCAPEQLELEITESAIINSVDFVIEACRRLKEMGVRLALDDFGTGYSSLAYLKRFPLDKLKVDQSFVRELPHDPEDMAISNAIIGLGHNLGLTVIAEGVEKSEQEAFLVAKDCEEAQGYLYSPPLPFDELLAFLKKPTPPQA